MSPQSSETKNKPSKKKKLREADRNASFLIGLFLGPEHGGDMFL
jgi:hypothetical protein